MTAWGIQTLNATRCRVFTENEYAICREMIMGDYGILRENNRYPVGGFTLRGGETAGRITGGLQQIENVPHVFTMPAVSREIPALR